MQCDFYAVHSLRVVVHTCLVPEIFITGIVLWTLFASAVAAIIHAKQIQDLLEWVRLLFLATINMATKKMQYPNTTKIVYSVQSFYNHLLMTCQGAGEVLYGFRGQK